MNKVIKEEILDNIIDNMQEWEAMQAAINILNGMAQMKLSRCW